MRPAAPSDDTSEHDAGPLWRRVLRRAVVSILAAPIHGYRLFLSPFTAPSCRFHPTCSVYALQALDVHGPMKGSWLALRRILSCHPVSWLGGRSGYDPVPPR